jgi:hypothetical protein
MVLGVPMAKAIPSDHQATEKMDDAEEMRVLPLAAKMQIPQLFVSPMQLAVRTRQASNSQVN